jgi:pimeloyl-ACP methyl ester carboxylesterase
VGVLVTSDGLRLAYERTGSGVPAVFVHANGFCKELWRPVLSHLSGVEAVSLDQRGHGESEAGQPPFDWWDSARDLLGLVAETNLDVPRIGVGHSSGAAQVAMAEMLHPGTFQRMVLIEPIINPPPYGRHDDHQWALGAERRRHVFPDRESTLRAYRQRGPFGGWDVEALDLYVEHGFFDSESGRTLRCSPEVEAEFFRSADTHRAWERLGDVGSRVTLVFGERSDTHTTELAKRLSTRFPNVEMVGIPGTTHFVPMERPEAVAELVREAAAAL